MSVDTKKKENLGKFKNTGRTYRRKGDGVPVKTHDFPRQGPRTRDYLTASTTSDETRLTCPSGSVAIRPNLPPPPSGRWWLKMGKKKYKAPQRLLIRADCGGSNNPRTRMWLNRPTAPKKRVGLNSGSLPLSTGNEQVEQDRTSALLPHHIQLTRIANSFTTKNGKS